MTKQRMLGTGLVSLTAVLASGAWAQQVVVSGNLVDASVAASMPEQSAVFLSQGSMPGEDPDKARWGTTVNHSYTVGPGDFIVREGCAGGVPDTANMTSIGPAVGETSICIGAPIHLPAGARIYDVSLFYSDDTTSTTISAGLWRTTIYPSGGTQSLVQSLTPAASSSGYRWQDFYLASPHTVTDNYHSTYSVLAILARSGSTVEKIYGVTIWYNLQISPAPATATFTDVPTSHWAYQSVEALKASGITSGTSATTFSPNNTVTRAELAVFLSRALGLHWPN